MIVRTSSLQTFHDGATSNSDKDDEEPNWPLQLHHTLTFQWLWQICTADPEGEMEGGRHDILFLSQESGGIRFDFFSQAKNDAARKHE